MKEDLIRPFLGTWLLDPQYTRYEFGEAPIRAQYQIEQLGEQVKVVVSWVTPEKKLLEHKAWLSPDGKEHKTDDQQSVIATLQENMLETILKFQKQIIGQTFRQVSPDGKAMQIMQLGATPEGKPYRNVSVYMKAE